MLRSGTRKRERTKPFKCAGAPLTNLPSDPAQAIKGTELIRLVRLRLGEEYSDASLRYHFSFMASEPDSEIAKVERGQGYYRRMRERDGQRAPRGLLPLFLGENEPDALNCRAKALALAVRQYDTTGRGVFVFSTSETGTSWVKPDLAVVEWPEGEWEGNALVFDKSALQRRRMIGAPMMGIRSVCVARMPGGEDGRREFFRTLATSRWAQCGELVIVGELPDDSECAALRGLAAEFGVGVLCLEIADERLGELPGAEEIFKAGDEECAALLAELTPVRLAAGRLKTLEADTGETLGGEFGALFDWLAACLERGSVEEYEFRVSCY